MNDLVNELIEVELKDDDTFLKVKETLTRIGIARKKDNTLFQSAHILHKRGRYYIVHFKQMFQLDGKETDFDDIDQERLHRIVRLLEEWDLVKIVDQKTVKTDFEFPESKVRIIRHKEKDEWNLVPKYNIGKK